VAPVHQPNQHPATMVKAEDDLIGTVEDDEIVIGLDRVMNPGMEYPVKPNPNKTRK
jgi:hypothetical protein